jgi:hypothetical protein
MRYTVNECALGGLGVMRSGGGRSGGVSTGGRSFVSTGGRGRHWPRWRGNQIIWAGGGWPYYYPVYYVQPQTVQQPFCVAPGNPVPTCNGTYYWNGNNLCCQPAQTQQTVLYY